MSMIGNEEKKQRPQDKWDEKAGLVPKTYKINKEVAEEFKEACKKYQKKAGWMTKGFKIKRELADEFAEACETAGVSQASKISELMKGFIEEVNNGK